MRRGRELRAVSRGVVEGEGVGVGNKSVKEQIEFVGLFHTAFNSIAS